MAVTTKILSDTKHHAKVLLTWNADSAATAAAVDASGLSDHANGAKLHITNINYGVNIGEVKLEFVGASSDVLAINLSGSGHYYGAVIKNTATNGGATGGDIKATTSNSSSGYALLTMQKVGFGEATESF
tara:strand:+ start:3682 stop:4071 length:390 start_codon:yes stop_codon:yes gene_type:complete